jgi:hypothetical protein
MFTNFIPEAYSAPEVEYLPWWSVDLSWQFSSFSFAFSLRSLSTVIDKKNAKDQVEINSMGLLNIIQCMIV